MSFSIITIISKTLPYTYLFLLISTTFITINIIIIKKCIVSTTMPTISHFLSQILEEYYNIYVYILRIRHENIIPQIVISYYLRLFLFKVTFLTFFTYVISDPDNNILTAEKIFVSMSLFFTMHLPLGLLPLIVVSVVEVEPRFLTTSTSQRLWFFLSYTNILTSIRYYLTGSRQMLVKSRLIFATLYL